MSSPESSVANVTEAKTVIDDPSSGSDDTPRPPTARDVFLRPSVLNKPSTRASQPPPNNLLLGRLPRDLQEHELRGWLQNSDLAQLRSVGLSAVAARTPAEAANHAWVEAIAKVPLPELLTDKPYDLLNPVSQLLILHSEFSHQTRHEIGEEPWNDDDFYASQRLKELTRLLQQRSERRRQQEGKEEKGNWVDGLENELKSYVRSLNDSAERPLTWRNIKDAFPFSVNPADNSLDFRELTAMFDLLREADKSATFQAALQSIPTPTSVESWVDGIRQEMQPHSLGRVTHLLFPSTLRRSDGTLRHLFAALEDACPLVTRLTLQNTDESSFNDIPWTAMEQHFPVLTAVNVESMQSLSFERDLLAVTREESEGFRTLMIRLRELSLGLYNDRERSKRGMYFMLEENELHAVNLRRLRVISSTTPPWLVNHFSTFPALEHLSLVELIRNPEEEPLTHLHNLRSVHVSTRIALETLAPALAAAPDAPAPAPVYIPIPVVSESEINAWTRLELLSVHGHNVTVALPELHPLWQRPVSRPPRIVAAPERRLVERLRNDELRDQYHLRVEAEAARLAPGFAQRNPHALEEADDLRRRRLEREQQQARLQALDAKVDIGILTPRQVKAYHNRAWLVVLDARTILPDSWKGRFPNLQRIDRDQWFYVTGRIARERLIKPRSRGQDPQRWARYYLRESERLPPDEQKNLDITSPVYQLAYRVANDTPSAFHADTHRGFTTGPPVKAARAAPRASSSSPSSPPPPALSARDAYLYPERVPRHVPPTVSDRFNGPGSTAWGHVPSALRRQLVTDFLSPADQARLRQTQRTTTAVRSRGQLVNRALAQAMNTFDIPDVKMKSSDYSMVNLLIALHEFSFDVGDYETLAMLEADDAMEKDGTWFNFDVDLTEETTALLVKTVRVWRRWEADHEGKDQDATWLEKLEHARQEVMEGLTNGVPPAEVPLVALSHLGARLNEQGRWYLENEYFFHQLRAFVFNQKVHRAISTPLPHQSVAQWVEKLREKVAPLRLAHATSLTIPAFYFLSDELVERVMAALGQTCPAVKHLFLEGHTPSFNVVPWNAMDKAFPNLAQLTIRTVDVPRARNEQIGVAASQQTGFRKLMARLEELSLGVDSVGTRVYGRLVWQLDNPVIQAPHLRHLRINDRDIAPWLVHPESSFPVLEHLSLRRLWRRPGWSLEHLRALRIVQIKGEAATSIVTEREINAWTRLEVLSLMRWRPGADFFNLPELNAFDVSSSAAPPGPPVPLQERQRAEWRRRAELRDRYAEEVEAKADEVGNLFAQRSPGILEEIDGRRRARAARAEEERKVELAYPSRAETAFLSEDDAQTYLNRRWLLVIEAGTPIPESWSERFPHLVVLTRKQWLLVVARIAKERLLRPTSEEQDPALALQHLVDQAGELETTQPWRIDTASYQLAYRSASTLPTGFHADGHQTATQLHQQRLKVAWRQDKARRAMVATDLTRDELDRQAKISQVMLRRSPAIYLPALGVGVRPMATPGQTPAERSSSRLDWAARGLLRLSAMVDGVHSELINPTLLQRLCRVLVEEGPIESQALTLGDPFSSGLDIQGSSDSDFDTPGAIRCQWTPAGHRSALLSYTTRRPHKAEQLVPVKQAQLVVLFVWGSGPGQTQGHSSAVVDAALQSLGDNQVAENPRVFTVDLDIQPPFVADPRTGENQAHLHLQHIVVWSKSSLRLPIQDPAHPELLQALNQRADGQQPIQSETFVSITTVGAIVRNGLYKAAGWAASTRAGDRQPVTTTNADLLFIRRKVRQLIRLCLAALRKFYQAHPGLVGGLAWTWDSFQAVQNVVVDGKHRGVKPVALPGAGVNAVRFLPIGSHNTNWAQHFFWSSESNPGTARSQALLFILRSVAGLHPLLRREATRVIFSTDNSLLPRLSNQNTGTLLLTVETAQLDAVNKMAQASRGRGLDQRETPLHQLWGLLAHIQGSPVHRPAAATRQSHALTNYVLHKLLVRVAGTALGNNWSAAAPQQLVANITRFYVRHVVHGEARVWQRFFNTHEKPGSVTAHAMVMRETFFWLWTLYLQNQPSHGGQSANLLETDFLLLAFAAAQTYAKPGLPELGDWLSATNLDPRHSLAVVKVCNSFLLAANKWTYAQPTRAVLPTQNWLRLTDTRSAISPRRAPPASPIGFPTESVVRRLQEQPLHTYSTLLQAWRVLYSPQLPAPHSQRSSNLSYL